MPSSARADLGRTSRIFRSRQKTRTLYLAPACVATRPTSIRMELLEVEVEVVVAPSLSSLSFRRRLLLLLSSPSTSISSPLLLLLFPSATPEHSSSARQRQAWSSVSGSRKWSSQP